MQHKEALLAQIAAEIIQDNVCPDLAKTAKHLVIGDGNPDADVVFIGEAPGKKEDELGLPFMGASGKLLGLMLESINLKRSDVYITNIVKYRPPNNRDPSSKEKQEFLPYLQKQIDVISPKLIITLGRHSGLCFDPQLVISNDHGTAKQIELAFNADTSPLTVQFLPLYHPAAALYNGGLKATLMDDFSQIPQLLSK